MLFSGTTTDKNVVTAIRASRTTDADTIRLGGACRLPVTTTETGKIRVARRVVIDHRDRIGLTPHQI